MSTEVRGTRKRAPVGFYSNLHQGFVGDKLQMADGQEHKGKTKAKHKSKSSSKGSKKSVRSMDEHDSMADMDKESVELGKELDELEHKDAHSKHLHALALKGQIQFIEDIDAPEELEKDEVWDKTVGEHEKEKGIIQVRLERLERKKQLMETKHQLRQQRLLLMQQEKELELQEKQRQMELGAKWLEMEKAEHEVQQGWYRQQRELEEFQKSKRLDGWVHDAAVHVSRGDVASMKSRDGKDRGASVNRLVKRAKEGDRGEMKRKGASLMAEGRSMMQNKSTTQGPLTGIKHLDKLGLLPSYGMEGEPSEVQFPLQDMGVRPKDVLGKDPWEQLSQCGEVGKNKHDSMHMVMGAQGEKVDKLERAKVKSGKYAKSHQDLVREESWPHLNALKQYAKRTTFDQMEFDLFVAGETRIIQAMMHKDVRRAQGRLKVLCKISHWLCRCKDWSSVRTIYESIIESVEMGEMDWTDAFDYYESLLPPPPSVLLNL